MLVILRLRCGQSGDDGLEGHGALAVFAGTFKVDPAFVESVDHPDARHGVCHALRAEELFPGLARNGLHTDFAAESGGKGPSDIGGRVTTRPLELDDPNTVPALLKERCGRVADIRRRHHRNDVIKRLQKAPHHAVSRRLYIPGRVFHEPADALERGRHRRFAPCLLGHLRIVEEIGFSDLRADRRQKHDLTRSRRHDRFLNRNGLGLRLRKAGLRIVVRRRHEETAVCAGKRGRQRVGIADARNSDLTALSAQGLPLPSSRTTARTFLPDAKSV